MIFKSRFRAASILFLVMGQFTLAQTANALVPKQDESSLESLAFVSEILRASPRSVPFDEVRGQDAAGIANAWDGFRKGHGDWNAIVDKRTGKLEIAEGEGIPFVPGRGNKLQMSDISSDSVEGKEPDLVDLEAIARAFLPDVATMLGVDPATLVLNQGRSGHPADYLWFIDFDVILDGIPVEGARVVFRVNNGNLIQFGSEYLPAEGIHTPKGRMTRNQALSVLASYIGGFSAADSFIDGGSQRLIPVALPNSHFPDGFERGKGRGLARTWQFIFRRDGDYGTWRARIDATSGKLLEFRDINDYASAQVAGGVTSLTGTETRPMPFADVSSPGYTNYTNSAGVYEYTGSPVSSTLSGQYVKINDSCGPISMTSDILGNFAFGTSTSTGDCSTPGFGGAGNTRASRTQFYAINRAKEIARGWLYLSWLNAQLITNVNRTDYNGDGICNAFWDGTTLNLYQKSTSCSNSGEIQGVGLHEFGHGLDANDGNGPSLDKGTGETYGDWTAALFTHNSCIGEGLLTSNCDGYGDPCTSCNGVRDIDYAKHSSNTPHTVSNFTQIRCPAGNGYIGPCGQKGHCESYVSSEALWDLVARDLPNPGTASAWGIMDRLWYLSRSTSTAAFTCWWTTPWSSDGCGSGSLWTTMRAVDDDDGNLSNGTPHSAALYAAFNRHGIACPYHAGASTSFRGCAQPAAPALSLAAANNQVTLNWSGPTGVYDVYRNEQGCGASFIKVANDLTNPLFVDTGVANDFTYYYQVIAQPNGSEGCASAPSLCLEALPCKPPAAPANLAATPVSASQIDLSWSSSSGATRYHIYRATTPNGPYTRIGARSGNTYSDTGLTSCTTHYYVVRAAGNATCESGNSIQVAATTIGDCLLNVSVSGAPDFAYVMSSPGGIYASAGSHSSATYPHGTSVTLLPNDGGMSQFLGWNGACTGTETCTVTMTQSHSVTATFVEIAELRVQADNGGIITSTPTGIQCGMGIGGWEVDCFTTYLAGTSVTLTATPMAGYTFTGWYSSPESLCTGAGTCTVTIMPGVYFYDFFPQFKRVETLTASINGSGTGTVTSSPNGINCGVDCSELYDYYATVTLTATPAASSIFSGWSGACTGTGSCTVTMSEARAVTATFSLASSVAVPTYFYTLLVPCRVFDSRITGPRLASGSFVTINIAGNCGVPTTAKAVSLNVTAITAPGEGFITLNPGDIGWPGTWTIGFPASLNRANNAVIPLAWNGNGTLMAIAEITGGGTMDMVLDVNGYFE